MFVYYWFSIRNFLHALHFYHGTFLFVLTCSYVQLWLTLAEQHLLRIGVDWSDVERNCFNDRINPDDEDLGAQIVRVFKIDIFLSLSIIS